MLEILRPYLKNNEIYSLDDILNGRIMHEILLQFDTESSISSISKVKYLAVLKDMIHFLAMNAMSPEREHQITNEELAAREFKLKDIDQQFQTRIAGLSKVIPVDAAKKRTLTSANLLSTEEIDAVLDSCKQRVMGVIEDFETNELESYTISQVLAVRDLLIVFCTTR